MNELWTWMKENVFKQVMGLIAVGILTGIWKIVGIISEVPQQLESAEKERIENKKHDEQQDIELKSLHRRITNLKTEMFYLKLGESPPKYPDE